MLEAICVGHAAYDVIFPLECFPREDGKYRVEDTIESSGGPAANAACLLASWGVATALVAPLGRDAFGEHVMGSLADHGVMRDLMEVDPAFSTPVSFIIANRRAGTRTIMTRVWGGRRCIVKEEALVRLSGGDPVKVLLFDGHEPEASLDLLRRFPGAVSVLDGGSLRAGTETLARAVEYAIVSERFALSWLRREDPRARWGWESADGVRAALRLLGSIAGRSRAITLGERGCIFYDSAADEYGRIGAYPARCVDTTAAGDIFHGAFAYAIATGESFRDALLRATVAAGLSVERKGGLSSLPMLAQVREAQARAGLAALPL
jgi:sulfofructose kinase